MSRAGFLQTGQYSIGVTGAVEGLPEHRKMVEESALRFNWEINVLGFTVGKRGSVIELWLSRDSLFLSGACASKDSLSVREMALSFYSLTRDLLRTSECAKTNIEQQSARKRKRVICPPLSVLPLVA
jgi:hypothetical protein